VGHELKIPEVAVADLARVMDLDSVRDVDGGT
jgi:hypothetical protein